MGQVQGFRGEMATGDNLNEWMDEEDRSPELIKVDGPILIDIEHPNHHLDRMRVERREIAIDERAAQLLLAQRARPVLVDRLEEREEGGVGAAVGARGRWRGRRA